MFDTEERISELVSIMMAAKDYTPTVLEIKNLVRDYGDLRAVDQLSLEIYQGEIFGFLGPNGAGK
ncbi:MAG: hypothetical protein KAT15_03265, partial [Bacteroidales bacterium]|nr:hypothetical protein [Bacteroidales bacterium]